MALAQWEHQRVRVYEDLSGLIKGRVLAEPVLLELFARDASVFHIRPLVVVRPQSVADVSACLQYCAENRIPVHARGAGTGLAGESLGPGVVIDFSAYMRRLVGIEDGGRFVRVQPGLVFERLQRSLRSFGRMLAPEVVNAAVTTCGGLLARDPRTSHSMKYGSVGDYLREVSVCLADGTRVHFGMECLGEHAGAPSLAPKSRLVLQVAQILQKYQQRVESRSGARLKGGYRLDGVLKNGVLNMPKLLAGSEGTLALVVEAGFETVPVPPARAMGLLLFDQLEPAFEAALEMLPFRPAACDLMDRRHLGLAREAEPWFQELIPEKTEAAVLVETHGYDVANALGELQSVLDHLRKVKRFNFSSRLTTDESEVNFLWKLARVPQPVAQRGGLHALPVPLADDVAVPPPQLADCVLRLQRLLREMQIPAAVYCHVGHGQIHLQPFLTGEEGRRQSCVRRLCEEVYGRVLDCGGSIGLGHGCGLSRTAYLPRQWGPDYELLVELKKVFDPLGILNPGKIIRDPQSDQWWNFLARTTGGAGYEPERSDESPEAVEAWRQREQGGEYPAGQYQASVVQESLKAGFSDSGTGFEKGPLLGAGTCPEEMNAEPSPVVTVSDGGPTEEQLPDVLEAQLDWHPSILSSLVAQCSACGHCRTQDPQSRMCPLFRAQPLEEASPRAKATLIRAILTRDLPLETVADDTFREIADLCVHCHMCRVECPSRVDIPRLMLEAKTAHTAAHGSSFSDWFLNRLEKVAARTARLAPLVNWALQNRQARWLLEKFTGIAHGRKLPRLHPPGFLRMAVWRRRHRPVRDGVPKVAYFVDVYATWFDVALAEALVAVLEHNGIRVYVPPEQRGAATAAIASGDLDYARRVARRNVMILAEAVRQGHDIVTTEPAAALTLIEEYPQILEEEDARLVAAHTYDACDYLWRLHEQGRLREDFRAVPIVLGYHWPCRLRAMGVGQPGLQLLRLVPELNVRPMPNGCSGMAGTYGLKQIHYRTSLRVGWPLLNGLRDPAIQAGVTECSACRMQMEQGTTKPTLHPIKVLAAAYGLRFGRYSGKWTDLLRPSRDLRLADI